MKNSKAKKYSDIKLLDDEKLAEEISKTGKEFYLLRMKGVSGELKQTHSLRDLRKSIARLMTEKSYRKINSL